MSNRTITVASGKGGVGKTTLVGNLGKVIAGMGHSVLLIDGDLERGGLDLTLGLENGNVFDLLDVVDGVSEIDKALSKVSSSMDLFFLAISSDNKRGSSLKSEDIKVVFDALKTKFAYIFIDCAAGNACAVQLFAKQSSEVLVVVTPERTSIREAERVVQSIENTNVRLVVNRVKPKQIVQGVAPDIDAIIDSIGARLLGIIPEDELVCAYQNAGILLVDTPSKSSLYLIDTAKRLVGENIKLRKV